MMQVWAVTMMRDEADVAETCIRHMADQGVNGIVVADNLSTDGTGNILRAVAKDLDWKLPIVVVDDHEPAYRQSQKMTALAARARLIAATDDLWIVPFDADELWVGRYSVSLTTADERRGGPLTVGTTLRLLADAGAAHADVYNHYATGQDDPGAPDPFRRMTWRDANCLPLPKVAVRWTDDLVIHQGNHGATVYGRDISSRLSPGPSPLLVHHYPYRSIDQVVRKVLNGAGAYEAAPDLPAEMGGHWRAMATTVLEHGAAALEAHLDRWFRFEDPTEGPDGVPMVHDPVL